MEARARDITTRRRQKILRGIAATWGSSADASSSRTTGEQGTAGSQGSKGGAGVQRGCGSEVEGMRWDWDGVMNPGVPLEPSDESMTCSRHCYNQPLSAALWSRSGVGMHEIGMDGLKSSYYCNYTYSRERSRPQSMFRQVNKPVGQIFCSAVCPCSRHRSAFPI